jgi:hypothetical protein
MASFLCRATALTVMPPVLLMLPHQVIGLSAYGLTVGCRVLGACAALDVGQQLPAVPTDIDVLITRLDLTQHLIESFVGDEFARFPLLEEVLLTLNPVRELAPDLFRFNPRLRVVILNKFKSVVYRYAGISSIPETLFDFNPMLETVDLDETGLTTLPSRLFR